MQDVTRTASITSTDIGWKQFAISVVDLARWPVAVIVIAMVMRQPIEGLMDAIAIALRS